jgi:hypothetical protein
MKARFLTAEQVINLSLVVARIDKARVARRFLKRKRSAPLDAERCYFWKRLT